MKKLTRRQAKKALLKERPFKVMGKWVWSPISANNFRGFKVKVGHSESGLGMNYRCEPTFTYCDTFKQACKIASI